jgi:hypothetical protein
MNQKIVKKFLTKFLMVFILLLTFMAGYAQPERWQQAAKYEMDIDFDVKKHQFEGIPKARLNQ